VIDVLLMLGVTTAFNYTGARARQVYALASSSVEGGIAASTKISLAKGSRVLVIWVVGAQDRSLMGSVM
jgi:hypothetical protein